MGTEGGSTPWSADAARDGPPSTGDDDRSVHPAVIALGLGIGYAALAGSVHLITSFGSSDPGSSFWPAAGLTVATLLWRPRDEWPLLLGAVAIAEFGVDLAKGIDPVLSMWFVAANVAEPAVGARLFDRRRRGDRPTLMASQNLLRFSLCAVVLGPATGAVLGTVGSVVTVDGSWWPQLGRWFVGDAIGVAVVAPAILVTRRDRLPVRDPVFLRFALLLIIITAVAFGPWKVASDWGLTFLVIPAVVLVALRGGTAGAAYGVAFIALVAEAVTASGRGPFIEADALSGLVVAQVCLSACAFSAHMVAALTGDLLTREQMEANQRELASHDPLTGLANRRLLADAIAVTATDGAGVDREMAMLFIDLDGFKLVNDRYGHDVGDAVLVEVASRLAGAVRDGDLPARLGGDEFLVLVGDPISKVALQTLRIRVMEAISEPMVFDDVVISIAASVGTARGPAAHGFESLVQAADRDMYRFKPQAAGLSPDQGPRPSPAR